MSSRNIGRDGAVVELGECDSSPLFAEATRIFVHSSENVARPPRALWMIEYVVNGEAIFNIQLVGVRLGWVQKVHTENRLNLSARERLIGVAELARVQRTLRCDWNSHEFRYGL